MSEGEFIVSWIVGSIVILGVSKIILVISDWRKSCFK